MLMMMKMMMMLMTRTLKQCPLVQLHPHRHPVRPLSVIWEEYVPGFEQKIKEMIGRREHQRVAQCHWLFSAPDAIVYKH